MRIFPIVLLYLTVPGLASPVQLSGSRNYLDQLGVKRLQTHECLYVYPDLPACDFERMQQDSEEEEEEDRTNRVPRSIAAVSGLHSQEASHGRRNVIVYTIEGCLPSRLPFAMPLCRGETSDKILEVRKLYPFAVAGLNEPTRIFPKFDYERWTRTMKRIRSRGGASKSRGNENPRSETEVESVEPDQKSRLRKGDRLRRKKAEFVKKTEKQRSKRTSPEGGGASRGAMNQGRRSASELGPNWGIESRKRRSVSVDLRVNRVSPEKSGVARVDGAAEEAGLIARHGSGAENASATFAENTFEKTTKKKLAISWKLRKRQKSKLPGQQ